MLCFIVVCRAAMKTIALLLIVSLLGAFQQVDARPRWSSPVAVMDSNMPAMNAYAPSLNRALRIRAILLRNLIDKRGAKTTKRYSIWQPIKVAEKAKAQSPTKLIMADLSRF